MESKQSDVVMPNWKQVSVFLGITFGLTYLLDLALYLTMRNGPNPGAGWLMNVQMLIPATVAIVLQFFFFRNSPIYRLQERPRWFFFAYLAYALLYAALAVLVVFIPNPIAQTIAGLAFQAATVIGLLGIVLLRLVSGKEAFARAGLSGGKVWHYLVFGLLLGSLYGLMTALNALFGLGQAVDVRQFIQQAGGGQASPLDQVPDLVLVLLLGFQTVILGPVLGWLIALGEEYGWRGYLQRELIKIGKVRGILLVGVIWGLWHAPVILMGQNYPGYPIAGVFLMTLYTIALAFFLGFAVLKSGSVWLAAYLHALNNQVLSFLVLVIYTPDDPVFSFGVGIYGLLIWAVVVGALLVLGRREWATPVEASSREAVTS